MDERRKAVAHELGRLGKQLPEVPPSAATVESYTLSLAKSLSTHFMIRDPQRPVLTLPLGHGSLTVVAG